jgi:acetyl-CoA carboxylase biotin carboxylase subunit
MRPDAAHRTQGPRARALILGPHSVARLIAVQMAEEGFEPVLEADLPFSWPVPSEPDAYGRLRANLREFAARSGDPAGGYAHCVHPGISIWADRPEILLIAQEMGLNVIAPPVRVVSLFSNKLNLLAEADRLGIPTLVLSFDPIYSVREIEKIALDASKRRFPFIIKSTRGGGGLGVFVVQAESDIERKLPLWIEQLRRNYGEAILFAERYMESARHILVPFARFRDGRFKTFPPTDSSLQSRYRKIVEFCPALGVDAEALDEMVAHTRHLAESTGFVGVGATEFLVDGSSPYLVEGIARLNAGFHLWEKIAGTRAVAWQVAALQSRDFPAEKPEREWTHGLSVRLYAEDSLLQLPCPGEVHEVSARREWRLPGAAAELQLAVEAGMVVTPEQDGLLGVMFVGAQEREQALAVARGVLDEMWISGSVQTNERFVSELLAHPFVREGMFHAGFVEEEFLPDVSPDAELLEYFASMASAAAPTDILKEARWAVGDQWIKPNPSKLRWIERRQSQDRAGQLVVEGILELMDGRKTRACLFPVAEGRWQVRIGQWILPVRQVLPSSRATKANRTRKLLSQVSGRVHSLLYREGSPVPAHEPALIVESLGMLVPHALPIETRLTSWKVRAEDEVRVGQHLADIEPLQPTAP